MRRYSSSTFFRGPNTPSNSPAVAENDGWRATRAAAASPSGTDGISIFALDIPKQIDITHLAFTILDIQQYFFHPADLRGRRTLSATFVAAELGQCIGMTYHALAVVDNDVHQI